MAFDLQPLPDVGFIVPTVEERCIQDWPGLDFGTGGQLSGFYFQNRTTGYLTFLVVRAPIGSSLTPGGQVKEIKDAFGRTFTHLTAVFGVSRQTLYNWLEGERPKTPNLDRIAEVAEAADVFRNREFVPRSQDLMRTLDQGKSFLELMAAGESGRAAAEKLVRVARHGAVTRSRLNSVLSRGTHAGTDTSNILTPALDERDT